jgi:hypothetical protein
MLRRNGRGSGHGIIRRVRMAGSAVHLRLSLVRRAEPDKRLSRFAPVPLGSRHPFSLEM